MKIHCARVAATLYHAELKIDVAPEEGRRELAEMLAEVAENFAAKRFSALYPDEKLLPKPAHDWDRLRSIGCAAAGILLLWWVSSWGLEGTAGTAACAAAFVAPFVATYGRDGAAAAMALWRNQ
ncbi:hypothetical protein [Kitasatospora sp. NPDC058046]|uniref:hypothetical protein n=1 Tax=Kitasatospora sp. NPDC058046 TaxID=3346312 RepID=UPI0036D9B019